MSATQQQMPCRSMTATEDQISDLQQIVASGSQPRTERSISKDSSSTTSSRSTSLETVADIVGIATGSAGPNVLKKYLPTVIMQSMEPNYGAGSQDSERAHRFFNL